MLYLVKSCAWMRSTALLHNVHLFRGDVRERSGFFFGGTVVIIFMAARAEILLLVVIFIHGSGVFAIHHTPDGIPHFAADAEVLLYVVIIDGSDIIALYRTLDGINRAQGTQCRVGSGLQGRLSCLVRKLSQVTAILRRGGR